MVDISVVIPSYNSSSSISACLQGVLSQKTKLKYEVILVDSGTDNSVQIVKERFPGVKVLKSSKRLFPGTARNVGIKAAKSEFIACIDSHCAPMGENWLDTVFFELQKYPMVGGSIHNANPSSIVGWGQHLFEFGDFICRKRKYDDWFPGCVMSVRKSVFSQYGGFSDVFRSGEDVVLGMKIPSKKLRSDRIMIKHYNKTGMVNVLKHLFSQGAWVAFAAMELSGNVSLKYKIGRFCTRYKFPIPFLAFYKFSISAWNALHSNYLPQFILVSPLVFLNSLAWTAGFLSASFENKIPKRIKRMWLW
jgi:glycosyltransferase involved in cell wall biosynthesis